MGMGAILLEFMVGKYKPLTRVRDMALIKKIDADTQSNILLQIEYNETIWRWLCSTN